MRKRLIKLIENAPRFIGEAADYFLENGVMVPPCKIGDVVYTIRHYKEGVRHVQKGIVHEMFFTDNMELCISVKHIARGLWGKTVFPTKEAAEQALKATYGERCVACGEEIPEGRQICLMCEKDGEE